MAGWSGSAARFPLYNPARGEARAGSNMPGTVKSYALLPYSCLDQHPPEWFRVCTNRLPRNLSFRGRYFFEGGGIFLLLASGRGNGHWMRRQTKVRRPTAANPTPCLLWTKALRSPYDGQNSVPATHRDCRVGFPPFLRSQRRIQDPRRRRRPPCRCPPRQALRRLGVCRPGPIPCAPYNPRSPLSIAMTRNYFPAAPDVRRLRRPHSQPDPLTSSEKRPAVSNPPRVPQPRRG